jgi:hypothetical protein
VGFSGGEEVGGFNTGRVDLVTFVLFVNSSLN